MLFTPVRRRDAGQATLEYAAMIALAAILVVSIAVVLHRTHLDSTVATAFCRVATAVTGGSCPAAAPDGDQEDQDQPWSCDWFGIGCHDEGGGEGDDEENGDHAADEPWHCDWFGIGCGDQDGGQQESTVDIPDGLDPDSDLVETLSSTERGRATLQWLADHDIPIEVRDDVEGAYWDGRAIVLGEGYDEAAVIVHEANHAKYTEEGRSADINDPDREAYVSAAIDEEVDGTVQQILAAQEFRTTGREIGVQPGQTAYDKAFQEAKDNGASDADAQTAGRQAVSDEFLNGDIRVSLEGNPSYPDYYGDAWDRAH